MQKIKLEEHNARKKRFTFLTSFTIGVTILLAFLQLILSNHLAGFGRDLAALSLEKKTLVHENEVLKKNIAGARSIATISEKAHTISLGAASNFLVIEERESVALLRVNEF